MRTGRVTGRCEPGGVLCAWDRVAHGTPGGGRVLSLAQSHSPRPCLMHMMYILEYLIKQNLFQKTTAAHLADTVHRAHSHHGQVSAMKVLAVNNLVEGRSLVGRLWLRSAVHLACKVPSAWEV